MEQLNNLGSYTYFWEQENIEFTLQIDKFWENIYKGKPREALYDSYTNVLNYVKKVNKDKYIVDIGANVGIFAVPCCKLGYKTICFEPVKANFDSLTNNLSSNNCSNFITIKSALLDKNEKITIYVPECHDNSSISKEAAVANMIRKGFYEEEIDCVTFDSWIEKNPEYNNIGFIKIDVQGADLMVVNGAKEFLKQAKDIYLVAEYEHHLLSMGYSYQQLDELLLSLGFSPVAQYGNDKVFYKQ